MTSRTPGSRAANRDKAVSGIPDSKIRDKADSEILDSRAANRDRAVSRTPGKVASAECGSHEYQEPGFGRVLFCRLSEIVKATSGTDVLGRLVFLSLGDADLPPYLLDAANSVDAVGQQTYGGVRDG
jgi:hypothetical protein